jgi:hypothetical protein
MLVVFDFLWLFCAIIFREGLQCKNIASITKDTDQKRISRLKTIKIKTLKKG